jgi:hypothetical protein
MTHMTQLQSKARKGAALAVIGLMFAALTVLFVGSAFAQDLACPAGGRGGAAGDGGRTTGGNGGLAFTVPGFGTTGAATAAGGNGASARGGDGGRGGTGTLPICNQNTNGAVRAAPGGGGHAAAPAAYGRGGGLARTGSRTYAELGLAGLAFVLGGGFLFFGQPLRRVRSTK